MPDDSPQLLPFLCQPNGRSSVHPAPSVCSPVAVTSPSSSKQAMSESEGASAHAMDVMNRKGEKVKKFKRAPESLVLNQ